MVWPNFIHGILTAFFLIIEEFYTKNFLTKFHQNIHVMACTVLDFVSLKKLTNFDSFLTISILGMLVKLRKTILRRWGLRKLRNLTFGGGVFAFSHVRWIIQIWHFKHEQMYIGQASTHGKCIQFECSLSGMAAKPSISSTISSFSFNFRWFQCWTMQSFSWKCTIVAWFFVLFCFLLVVTCSIVIRCSIAI